MVWALLLEQLLESRCVGVSLLNTLSRSIHCRDSVIWLALAVRGTQVVVVTRAVVRVLPLATAVVLLLGAVRLILVELFVFLVSPLLP